MDPLKNSAFLPIILHFISYCYPQKASASNEKDCIGDFSGFCAYDSDCCKSACGTYCQCNGACEPTPGSVIWK